MIELGMSYGTWADAENAVGTVVAEIEGADTVERSMVRHYLESLEWDDPGFLDADGVIAPASMYLTFGMAPYWSPGDPPLRENSLAPLAFGRVPCPGSAMLATEISTEFFEPMREGDRLRSEWVLAKLTRKTLALGDGAFLEFEVTYRNQREQVVAVERTTAFRYEPAGR